MKFYLSSYKIGNRGDKLKEMATKHNRVAYIPNAKDGSADPERSRQSIAQDIADLQALGFEVEVLDLKEYFDKHEQLKTKIHDFCVIWVAGGNTFVLRQAMKLSGFDTVLYSLWVSRVKVIYGGYSAGICVLCPTLKGIHLADDPELKPYGQEHETIWEGLNIIPYCIAPHYRSDHFESPLIEKCIEYYIEHKILFKALHDGDVIVIE